MLHSPDPTGTLLRTVVWRNLAAPGSDFCSLWRTGRGWLLRGAAITAPKTTQPVFADYEIECDQLWHTRRVAVTCLLGSISRSIDLTVEASGAWRDSGEEQTALRGCIDIDLELTPATNALPIRRLNLEAGQSEEVTAAWLKFPDLTLEILHQRYTRLDRNRYRYESDTGFSAELRVDELGLVMTYPGGWDLAATL